MFYKHRIMKITLSDCEHYTWGNACDGWHFLKSPTLNVIKEQMPSGTSEALHYHAKAQQLFYILSGLATFEIEGELLEVKANEVMHIAAGKRHRIFNNQEEVLVFLLVSEPPAQNDRVNV